jgi:hypothetical protein
LRHLDALLARLIAGYGDEGGAAVHLSIALFVHRLLNRV